MLYIYLQIISLIFSFTTSSFELYRSTKTTNLTNELLILFNLRLITSLFSSIYYTANNIDPLICLNAYKNVCAVLLVISIRSFFYYRNLQNEKPAEEDFFVEVISQS